MLERDIEKKIVRYCHDQGLLAYKFTSPAHRGVPDRLIIGRGKTFFMEIKRKGNRPTSLQTREIERINQRGIKATWCDSYEDAVKLINEHFGTDVI